MGRNRHRDGDKNRLPPFVPLLVETLDSPAWQALSHKSKILYIALKRRYSSKLHNNGRLFLSQRKAAAELGSHHNQIARWYRELQHFGFIVMHAPGFLGVEGIGQAPRWRLTELGHMGDPPTRDYLRWNGEEFVDQKKSRAANPARTVREKRRGCVQESSPINGNSVLEKLHKDLGQDNAGKAAQI